MLLGCFQSPSIAPCHLEEPTPLHLLFLCFCSDGSNQHKIWAAGGKSVFIWDLRSGVGKAIWEQFYFRLFQESGDSAWSSFRCCLYPWRRTTHHPKEPVLLIALDIMRHAKLCLSVILFLICVPNSDTFSTAVRTQNNIHVGKFETVLREHCSAS